MMSKSTRRVIITIPSEYINRLDGLVSHGIAPSRNALIEKIIAGFLSDLQNSRKSTDSALGSLIGFILLMVGIGFIASLFKGEG
jgi:metal-responsive CopG/Arc/MetJ family transcriptional regulator